MNAFYYLLTILFGIGFTIKLAYHVLFEIPRDNLVVTHQHDTESPNTSRHDQELRSDALTDGNGRGTHSRGDLGV